MSLACHLPPVGFSEDLYEGPYTGHSEFLDDQVFWIHHLARSPAVCGYAEEAEEDFLLDPYDDACNEFHQRLLEAAESTVFTVPLKSGSSLHIVYCIAEGDHVSVDYRLSYPERDTTDALAYLYGQHDGYPALSWPELAAAAHSDAPGGSTQDPHKRLLLLWPAMGDDSISGEAATTLAEALSACTSASDPERLARMLAAAQRDTRWRSEDGIRVNDARLSFRNPSGHSSLSNEELARVSAALEP